MVTVLHGHTSAETAYLVDDYPYGFRLRCKIRYWVETAHKGASKGQQRFMSQTTNPKVAGEPWNKPKGSTYSLMVFMFLDDEQHVRHCGVSQYGATPEGDAWLRLSGIYAQLGDEQRERYDAIVAASRQGYAPPWGQFEDMVKRLAEWMRDNGPVLPPLENNVWTDADGRRFYLGTSEHQQRIVYTAALRRLETHPDTA